MVHLTKFPRGLRRVRSGFVMIEALFAMFLILTGVLVVAATMPASNVSRNKASLADKAMDVAQKQMEAIRGAGFSNGNPGQLLSLGLIDSTTTTSANTYSFTNSDSSNLDNPATVLPDGAGTVTIQEITLNLSRITVTVTYTESGNRRSYSIGTLEANL